MPRMDEPTTTPVEGSEHLPSAVAWVRMHANRNRQRLPADAHVTLLQTCQVLDAVLEAEQRERGGDQFDQEDRSELHALAGRLPVEVRVRQAHPGAGEEHAGDREGDERQRRDGGGRASLAGGGDARRAAP